MNGSKEDELILALSIILTFIIIFAFANCSF